MGRGTPVRADMVERIEDRAWDVRVVKSWEEEGGVWRCPVGTRTMTASQPGGAAVGSIRLGTLT